MASEESEYDKEQSWRSDARSFGHSLVQHWWKWVGLAAGGTFISGYQIMGGAVPYWLGPLILSIGLTVAAFQAFRGERRKGEALTKALSDAEKTIRSLQLANAPMAPARFSLECNKSAHHCLADWTGQKTLCFRVNVSHNHPYQGIGLCYGRMVRIEKDGKAFNRPEREQLPFAPCQSEDSVKKTIPAGEICQLDFLGIHYGQKPELVVFVGAKGQMSEPQDFDRRDVFAVSPATYDIFISVHGNGIAAKYGHLRFFWSGDRNSSNMELIEQSDQPQ